MMARLRSCPYCGHEMRPGTRRTPTVDHVLPKSRGGILDAGNKLVVCRTCNCDKASMPLGDWHARLVLDGDGRADRVAGVLEVHAEIAAVWPSGGGDLSRSRFR